ncbi:Uncharacterised protein [Shigella sonnei]|nr:Uncharacterised protein [Shigella sonnei]
MIEKNIIQPKRPCRRLCIRVFVVIVGKIKRPVIVLFGEANQARVGLFELDPRQPDRFGQQRQRCQRCLYSRQMHHRDFGNIRWITKNDVFCMYMRPRHPAAPASFLFLPLPHHAQIATDSERTIQLRRDFLVDGRFESIPVKSCNQNDRHDNQQQESP